MRPELLEGPPQHWTMCTYLTFGDLEGKLDVLRVE